MKLRRCEDTHGQRVNCIACGKSEVLASAYADLEGEPFRAYYCIDCADAERRKYLAYLCEAP